MATNNTAFIAKNGLTTPGRIQVDDITDATTTLDGSIQTDGGLSVAKSAVIGAASKIYSNSTSQCNFYGYCVEATSAESYKIYDGQITLGSSPSYQARISYAGGTPGQEHVYYNNTYNATNRGHVFRVRTSGTPVESLKIVDTQVTIPLTTASTSTTTGAFTVAGGAGIGGTLYAARLATTSTQTLTSGGYNQTTSTLNLNPGAASTSTFTSVVGDSQVSPECIYNITSVRGGTFAANHYGSGTVSALQGCVTSTLSRTASGTVTNLYGSYIQFGNYTSGGTVTNAYGQYIASPYVTGTITNAYGLRIENITGATTNNYSIRTGTGLVDFGDNVIIKNTNTISTATITTTSVSQAVLTSISGSLYRSVKFQIQGVDSTGSKFHTTEIIAVHNGITASGTEYGSVNIGGVTGTFSVDYNSGNIRLLVTPASTNSTVFKVSMSILSA